MAPPQVSGALAILLSTGLRPQQAVDQLLATATDLGPAGREPSFGSGRIDVDRDVSSARVPPSSRTATNAQPATCAPTPANPPTTLAPPVHTTPTTHPPPCGPPPTP